MEGHVALAPLDTADVGPVPAAAQREHLKIAVVLEIAPSELIARFQSELGWGTIAAGRLDQLRPLLRRS